MPKANALRVLEAPRRPPWPTLIAELEALVERAKRGEIQAIAFVLEDAAGQTESMRFHYQRSHTIRLLGELRVLEQRLLRSELDTRNLVPFGE